MLTPNSGGQAKGYVHKGLIWHALDLKLKIAFHKIILIGLLEE